MILLDTSFIVAYKIENDEHHKEAVELMKKITENEYGKPQITDYIFDETVTVILSKSKKLSVAIEVGNELKKSLDIIKIDESIFEDSWNIFKTQKETAFSFTDCTSVSTMRDRDIKNIATFDADFKKITDFNVVDK